MRVLGHREVPGRPQIYATTKTFLDDLNLRSLEELPPLEDLQSALEPAPQSLAIDPASAAPGQDSLIGEDTSDTENAGQQEPNTHAG